MILPSVHQLCAHTWELFSLNDSASVAKWSENPLKAWNKHVRSFQSGPSLRALQKSQKNNLRDVLRRMLIRSNPVIASKYPRHMCSLCGEVGHTARSARHKISLAATSEEELILSFYQ